jgi:hypothetical protein
MRHRLFTLEEANESVPFLKDAFQRLAPAQEELTTMRERLLGLQRQRRSNGSSSSESESSRLQGEMDRLVRRLEETLEEITDRGIIVRDVASGLVDFPSLREGREVYLCWISGEDRIEYWHETDRGFAHRQPL